MEYTHTDWNGFDRLDFSFEGKEAILVRPAQADAGRHYLIKTEYFGAFPAAEIEMLRHGWHLAYVQNDTRWGTVPDEERRGRFCEFLTREFGLAWKCIPVGMSCGGLHAICFAAQRPDLISALYLDAPVLNLLSCPLGMGHGRRLEDAWQEVRAAWGVDEISILSFRQHPLDRLEPLIAHRIPVLMIYGKADETVPYEENGGLLEARWREADIDIEVFGKPGCGHHPHGLEDLTPMIRFFLNHA